MSSMSAPLSLAFASLGRLYAHLLTMLWPTIVLVLEKDWAMSYAELLPLAVAGQVLFGAGALPAGWLGDRWSATGMMVVFFIGTGLATVATGFAESPWQLVLGMAVARPFGPRYYPRCAASRVR